MTAPTIQVVVAAETSPIGFSFVLGGAESHAFEVLFVWPVVYSAFFLSRWELGAQVTLVAAVYAAALIAQPVERDGFLAVWLFTMAGLVVAAAFISQLIQQRRELERPRQHLAALVEAATDPIIGTSPAGVVESWNSGATALFGYSSGDAVGRPFSELVPVDRHDEFDDIFSSLRDGSEFEDHETTLLYEGSRGIAVSLTLAPMRDSAGTVRGVSTTARDISERRHLEELNERRLAESETRARTDSLTVLANRRAWDDELNRELARAGRHGLPVCVAMLDLDHFKAFNDEHGHLAGDELLKQLAISWQAVLRDGDFIARYGGEEFAVLLPNCSVGDAVQAVERLRVSAPTDQTCSAGVAYWDQAESASELLRRADGALYEAKRTGRDRLLTA